MPDFVLPTEENGGVFENRLYDSDENVFVKRYWIVL